MLSWELFSLDLSSLQYWMRLPRVAPAERRKQKSDVASATISVMICPWYGNYLPWTSYIQSLPMVVKTAQPALCEVWYDFHYSLEHR